MAVIYLWGNHAIEAKQDLHKKLKMKWSRKKRRFYRNKVDGKTLKKITVYCMKNKINYRTDDGQSYEVIESELFDAPQRELREWGPRSPKNTSFPNNMGYEQMWKNRED